MNWNGLRVIAPSQGFQSSFLKMLDDFDRDNPMSAAFYASARIDFDQYVQNLLNEELGINLPKDWVPCSHLWLISEEDHIVGVSRLRHNIDSEMVRDNFGHVGFDIAPSFRGKGYGHVALRAALERARVIGLSKVLLYTAESNVPSRKIIEKSGGQLKQIVFSPFWKEQTCAYWLPIYPHGLNPRLIEMLSELDISSEYLASRQLLELQEAVDLVAAEVSTSGREHLLTQTAAGAWRMLKDAAANQGIHLMIVSAFRSIDRQAEIVRLKLEAGLTIEEILSVSAPPGFSEHHTGRAVDITTAGSPALQLEFEQTPAYAWLSAHADEFGFFLSYPKENRFGYQYEPWHWCFDENVKLLQA